MRNWANFANSPTSPRRKTPDPRPLPRGTVIKRIACYISGHGYGHAVRQSVVLEGLMDRFSIHIKSEVPESFFRLYLGEKFSYTHQPVDPGVIQKDFIDIDVEGCFRRLAAFQATAAKRLEAEKRWLGEQGIDLVLTDCSSLPLKAARALGLPSLVVSNFTWHDIYSHFPGAARQHPLIDALREEYGHATGHLLPQCHIEGDAVPRRKEIGFIARTGIDRRRALEQEWPGVLGGKTIVFIYLGEAGSSRIDWPRLARLEDVAFLTRDPVAGTAPNLLVLDEKYRYPDLIASADVVLTKAGYSTLATAFAHGKPVLSCRREHFREFEFIESYLKDHGLGRIIEDKRFFACDWQEDIAQARELSVANRVALDGAEAVSREVEASLGRPRPGGSGL